MALPWIAYVIGWCIATVCKQKHEDRVAIAIEAGIQNTGIAIYILRTTLDQPQADLTTVVSAYAWLQCQVKSFNFNWNSFHRYQFPWHWWHQFRCSFTSSTWKAKIGMFRGISFFCLKKIKWFSISYGSHSFSGSVNIVVVRKLYQPIQMSNIPIKPMNNSLYAYGNAQKQLKTIREADKPKPLS